MSRVWIDLNTKGLGSVIIDGIDVSNLVGDVRVDAPAGDRPTVHLTLASGVVGLALATGVVGLLADAAVELDEQTRELLVHLGWTPPEEAT